MMSAKCVDSASLPPTYPRLAIHSLFGNPPSLNLYGRHIPLFPGAEPNGHDRSAIRAAEREKGASHCPRSKVREERARASERDCAFCAGLIVSEAPEHRMEECTIVGLWALLLSSRPLIESAA